MPSPSRASCTTSAQSIVAGGELIGGAKECLPPGESPRAPLLLQPREAQGDFRRFLVKHRGRSILARVRADHRARETVMRGDQVKDQIALVLAKVADALLVLNTKERPQFVPITVKQTLVDRTFGLCVNTILGSVESSLPPRRALAFVVQAGCEGENALVLCVEPKRLREVASPLFGVPMMFYEKLPSPLRTIILSRGIVPPFLHGKPPARLALFGDFAGKAEPFAPVRIARSSFGSLYANAEPDSLVIEQPVLQSAKSCVDDQRGAGERIFELALELILVWRRLQSP